MCIVQVCCPRGTYNEQGLGITNHEKSQDSTSGPIPKELRRIRRQKDNEEELLTSGSLTLAISRLTLRLRSAAPTLRHKAANAAHRPALRADQFNKDIERQKKEVSVAAERQANAPVPGPERQF